MPDKKSEDHRQSPSAAQDFEGNDLEWGATNLGRIIKRTEGQFYYLYRIGALKGAVKKIGHRTFVGSRRRLHALLLDE